MNIDELKNDKTDYYVIPITAWILVLAMNFNHEKMIYAKPVYDQDACATHTLLDNNEEIISTIPANDSYLIRNCDNPEFEAFYIKGCLYNINECWGNIDELISENLSNKVEQ